MSWEWLYSLWPSLPTVALVTAYFKARDAQRRKASGSTLIVTDGVDRRMVRWAKLNLRSWTDTPITIRRVHVLWPLGLGGFMYVDEQQAVATALFDRSIVLPEGCRTIEMAPAIEMPLNNALRLTFFVKPSKSLRQSKRRRRLRVCIVGETIDAQRRRVWLSLRSGPVDWSKPPQQ